jgi:cytochrome c-type biogenesis protein CcmE
MKPKHARALWLLVGLASVALGVFVLLTTFRDNIVFFFSPTEVLAKEIPPSRRIRVGGLIVAGSVKKAGQEVRFTITDTNHEMEVVYSGILPNLFREGIGIVAEGHMSGSAFMADKLLAKHDENYMPPDVAKALKDAGHWKTQYPAAKGGTE